MSFRSKFSLVVISASVALYAVVGGWLSTSAQQPANDPGSQLRIFESVLQHIQNDYVDEPNMEKVKDFKADKSENLPGIGAELSQVSSYLFVVSPVKGSPADQAGVRAGDVI